MEKLETIATPRAAVLLTGESGSGQELASRACCTNAAAGATGPWSSWNCAAVPPSLIEAELFGTSRGAFTGAVKKREGGSRPPTAGRCSSTRSATCRQTQAKLLRVLQEARSSPSLERSFKVDVRLVSATNRDLRAMVAEGQFREGSLLPHQGLRSAPAVAARASCDCPLLFK